MCPAHFKLAPSPSSLSSNSPPCPLLPAPPRPARPLCSFHAETLGVTSTSQNGVPGRASMNLAGRGSKSPRVEGFGLRACDGGTHAWLVPSRFGPCPDQEREPAPLRALILVWSKPAWDWSFWQRLLELEDSRSPGPRRPSFRQGEGCAHPQVRQLHCGAVSKQVGARAGPRTMGPRDAGEIATLPTVTPGKRESSSHLRQKAGPLARPDEGEQTVLSPPQHQLTARVLVPIATAVLPHSSGSQPKGHRDGPSGAGAEGPGRTHGGDDEPLPSPLSQWLFILRVCTPGLPWWGPSLVI